MNDPELEYATAIPKVPEGTGLEAWSIALIIAATVLVLIAIVGYFEFRSRRKRDDLLVDPNEPTDTPSGPRSDAGSDFRDAEEGKVNNYDQLGAGVEVSQAGTKLLDEPDGVGAKEDVPLQETKQKKDASSDALYDAKDEEEGKEKGPDPTTEAHHTGVTLQDTESQGDDVIGTADDIALTDNIQENHDVGLINRGFENDVDENTQL